MLHNRRALQTDDLASLRVLGLLNRAGPPVAAAASKNAARSEPTFVGSEHSTITRCRSGNVLR